MLTNREVLEGYRSAGLEMKALQEHIRLLGELSGVQLMAVAEPCRAEAREARLTEVEALQRELDAKWAELSGLQRRFEGLMARLPAMDRALMRSYYVLGLSDEKTAESMNMSRSSVITRRHRCLTRIEALPETEGRCPNA